MFKGVKLPLGNSKQGPSRHMIHAEVLMYLALDSIHFRFVLWEMVHKVEEMLGPSSACLLFVGDCLKIVLLALKHNNIRHC